MSDDRHGLDELKAALADNVQALAVELLGEPTSRQGYSWRGEATARWQSMSKAAGGAGGIALKLTKAARSLTCMPSRKVSPYQHLVRV